MIYVDRLFSHLGCERPCRIFVVLIVQDPTQRKHVLLVRLYESMSSTADHAAIAGDHSKQDQMILLIVIIGKYTCFERTAGPIYYVRKYCRLGVMISLRPSTVDDQARIEGLPEESSGPKTPALLYKFVSHYTQYLVCVCTCRTSYHTGRKRKNSRWAFCCCAVSNQNQV